MLRLSNDAFSCDYGNRSGIDAQIQTCKPSADWDLPVRELLAECVPPCTASDNNNTDSDLRAIRYKVCVCMNTNK